MERREGEGGGGRGECERNSSLLQDSLLQGLISALCLPVARPPALENVWSGLVCVLYPNREFASAAHGAQTPNAI